MFVKGKVENWIVLIETNNRGLFDLDINAILKTLEYILVSYNCILEKLFILNPSWIFK